MNVSNTLSTLAAMGLATLRQRIVLAKLVNRQYEGAINSATKFATVNVVVPSAVAAVAVTAGATPPATASTTPTVVPVQLTEHEEAPFYLSDVDLAKVNMGIIPMQAAEAVKALANRIDAFVWGKYKSFYGYAGVAGTTPFATDLTDYTSARKIANNQLMPLNDRFVVLNTDAEANAINLRAFQDASFAGDRDVIVEGQIGRKLGALWAMSQNAVSHTAGTGSGYLINNGGGYAAGIKTVAVDTGTGTILVGDIVTFAGVSGTYAVTAALAANQFSFEPGLAGAVADNAAITLKATHAVNLLIHRDAIAFAMAPMIESNIAPNLTAMQSVVDEESGLSLRLELTREHKRWRWSFDALWGAAVPRPELGVRIAG